ncbi:hypothetical protein [Mycobacteroides abscessus]|uniref:hypothetical protein n=1 Tax=Mycobacteroides abscessus TaxID=36809 RepID=UPI0012FFD44F|nr:hypothetical protein [Mycobacteroides abscessus]
MATVEMTANTITEQFRFLALATAARGKANGRRHRTDGLPDLAAGQALVANLADTAAVMGALFGQLAHWAGAEANAPGAAASLSEASGRVQDCARHLLEARDELRPRPKQGRNIPN